MYEVRFHGRGGQGAVTAAHTLADAAFREDKDVQSFPMFGVERRGAPVAAFARIDEKEIDIKTQIYEPDIVIVLDMSLLDVVDVTDGLKEGGKIILNTDKDPSEFDYPDVEVYTVNATKIAVENGLGTETNPIVNTAILGAYSRVAGNVEMENVKKGIENNVPVKHDENKKAAEEAYENVVGV